MIRIKDLFRAKKKSGEKLEMNIRIATVLAFAIGAVILLLNFYFLSIPSQMHGIVNLFAAVIIIGVPLAYKYNEYKKIKKIENLFPRYLRDVAENISTGMTLPQAMRTAAKNDYGELTPYAKSLSAKIGWGIPFEIILMDFANNTGSKTMKRNVQTIIETHRSGGTIDTVLKSVAQSLQELERIKRERASSIYAQMINGYLIYVVFLGVMIGLATILVPSFTKFGDADPNIQGTFTETFRALTIIQGFFAGIAIGKMAEGTIVAGLKHAMALVILGYSAFIIFG